jgi:HEPN domain-containing protein
MPHDPILIADTRGWLIKAANDLRVAEIVLAVNPPLLEDVMFHCQQAAEKSLKAFLTFHNRPFRKTHSLEEIGESCLVIDKTLAPIIDKAVPLTEYAWAFRYPGEPETPGIEEAKEALASAQSVYRSILDRLPEETCP